MSQFSTEEKRKFMLKKHLKNHLPEYILDLVGPVLLTVVILYICHAEKMIYGIIFSLAYGLGKTGYNIYHYKKDYVDRDIR